MAHAQLKPAGNTCTTLEERKDYALLPGTSKGYLTEKVEYAMKFPKSIRIQTRDGNVVTRLLMQVVTSGQILMDEKLHDYYWQYKAEVSFDMVPTLRGHPPKPFLSGGKQDNPVGTAKDPLRRHSLNPFPPGHTAGLLRRPDVIIVKNESLRWPGLATTDHEGKPHPDNLRRVVELKFPGDTLDTYQRDAYELIAGGGRSRLCIVDVNDCDGELERARQSAPVMMPAPEKKRQTAAIRSKTPIAEPAFFEQWLAEAGQVSQALWADLCAGTAQLSKEAQSWLKREAPWLFTAGRWVRDTSGQVYQWVNDKGAVIATWTLAQLRSAWAQIAEASDLAWEQIKLIDWSQVLIDTVKGLCVIGILIAGVMIVITLSPYLVAAFTALIGIASLNAA